MDPIHVLELVELENKVVFIKRMRPFVSRSSVVVICSLIVLHA